MKVRKTEFIVSNSDYKKCPKDNIPEFAFIGRSNVGKSSLINMLVERKSLAKTSGKPGKTQLINHFKINESWFLVDLPGYGWAQVSKTSRRQFEKIVTGYLLNRKNLVSTFVLIDIRLEPQKKDLEFINWLGENGIPFIILFTKTDKLSKQKVQQSMATFKKAMLKDWEELPPMIQTSSVNQAGREELLDYIEKYLNISR